MVPQAGTSTCEAEARGLKERLSWLYRKTASQNTTKQSSLNSQRQDLFVAVSLGAMERSHPISSPVTAIFPTEQWPHFWPLGLLNELLCVHLSSGSADSSILGGGDVSCLQDHVVQTHRL